MLFNSIEFLIFLPVVFSLYWLINGKNLRIQNAFLVIASYFFYGWWDYRFLSLIAFSTLVDYLVGIGLGKTENVSKRKLLLLTSMALIIVSATQAGRPASSVRCHPCGTGL
jgi:D-alanyl-lipoteichoic acid acyltransferase DltB (MBOAT superfamily)